MSINIKRDRPEQASFKKAQNKWCFQKKTVEFTSHYSLGNGIVNGLHQYFQHYLMCWTSIFPPVCLELIPYLCRTTAIVSSLEQHLIAYETAAVCGALISTVYMLPSRRLPLRLQS